MGESTVTLDKPMFAGQCVLDNSKVTMDEFHYGYMKPKYSTVLLRYAFGKPFYEDIREDVPKMFDTSAYPDDHPSGIPRMKKVRGMMKDEAAGRIIIEFVGLKPKMYGYKIDEYDGMCEKEFCDGRCGKECVGNGGQECKGVKSGVVKDIITTEHYKDCLFNDKTYQAKFNTSRSRKHEITTEYITKIVLSANDDKRIIIPNDPEHRTIAIDHWRAKHLALHRVEINLDELFEKGTLMNLAYNAIQ